MQPQHQPLQLAEPAFLRENWKVVLGTNCPTNMSVVRVQDGVATVTNGKLLLRSPIKIADGFYQLADNNTLLGAAEADVWGYPDPFSCYQPFDKMQPSPALSTNFVRWLINWLEEARRLKTMVVVDKYGIIPMSRDLTGVDFRKIFGTEFPFSGEEIGLSPHYLKLALVEMLRYSGPEADKDACCFMSHYRRADRATPLVIGHGWDRCALVMPTRY